MKPSLSAPLSAPRLNSLRDRLEKKPGPEDEPYLDQLMMFLDHPPQDVGDRWKAGAEMCAQWGVTTSGTSVWRLYLSYLFEWRIRAVLGEELKDASLHDLRLHFSRLVALRSCELLTNPETSAKVVIKFARIEQREKALELERQKLEDRRQALADQRQDEVNERAEKRALGRQAAEEFKAALGLAPVGFPPPKPAPGRPAK
jgi:hypothetical protein